MQEGIVKQGPEVVIQDYTLPSFKEKSTEKRKKLRKRLVGDK
jgi:hypothetical protein